MASRTILEICQSAALELGIKSPESVFGQSSRTLQELSRMAEKAATIISREHEWPQLKVRHVLTGDGVASEYPLPDDYYRMPKDTRLWSSKYYAPLPAMPSTDDLVNVSSRGFTYTTPSWTIIGEVLHFYPVLGDGETVEFYYLSDQKVLSSNDQTKQAFSNDMDKTRLNDLTLELGLIWRWKKAKGQPYAEDMTDYEMALAQDISRAKGARTLVQRSKGRMEANLAYLGNITP